MGRHKGHVLLPAGVTHPVNPTVKVFAKAYAEASPDDQAELRVWMRKIVMPGKARRDDIALARRIEKESIKACDKRILDFPLTVSPREVAEALKAEGRYKRNDRLLYRISRQETAQKGRAGGTSVLGTKMEE
jgi:hypothetical protein